MTDLEKLTMRTAIDLVSWQEAAWNKRGGIVVENVPGDPGGETYLGIDRRDNPNFDFANPTPEKGWADYEAEWQEHNYGLLPPDIAICVFSAGVNLGDATAIQILQRVCGVETDGVIGPITAAAARKVTVRMFCFAWEHHYRTLGPALVERFLKGWLDRVAHAEDWAGVVKFYQSAPQCSAYNRMAI